MTGNFTLVCFALKEEAAPFGKIAVRRSDIFTLIVGIGWQNAEKSVREYLATNSPGFVLTCGFAGGLNPDLKLGDVVFEIPSQKDKMADEIGDAWAVAFRNKLLAAGAKPASFFCADRISTTVAEKQSLRAETGVDVVEMESAAIQSVCAERGIPCVTIRVISDTANEDLPLDFNALSKPDKNLDFGMLAWAIAKSPGKIGALIELQKKTSFAARQLAVVLEKIAFPEM